MESIEKLRTAARNMAKGRNLENHEECNLFWCIANEIEREIAERFAELPVDADGVPIHVGDSIEYPNGTHDIVRFITVNDNAPTFNESGWVASKCHHVKPRTVEDVLNELLDDYMNDVRRDDEDIIAKYAAELQMRGDAE